MPLADKSGGVAGLFEHVGQGEVIRIKSERRVAIKNAGLPRRLAPCILASQNRVAGGRASR